MKKLILALAATSILTGCAKSLEQKADEYLDTSFMLCSAEVKTFSQSDDRKTRIVCEDGAYFVMSNYSTLSVMQELDGSYCHGSGLHKFYESNRYYTFQCKSGGNFSIDK